VPGACTREGVGGEGGGGGGGGGSRRTPADHQHVTCTKHRNIAGRLSNCLFRIAHGEGCHMPFAIVRDRSIEHRVHCKNRTSAPRNIRRPTVIQIACGRNRSRGNISR